MIHTFIFLSTEKQIKNLSRVSCLRVGGKVWKPGYNTTLMPSLCFVDINIFSLSSVTQMYMIKLFIHLYMALHKVLFEHLCQHILVLCYSMSFQ